MKTRGVLCMAATALLILIGFAPPDHARAQATGGEITLKSFDGFTQLRGVLKEFDGSTYTLETVLGTIQVDALQVNCEGEACPPDVLFGSVFAMQGSNTIGAQLMPALIEGYADSLDAKLVIENGQGPYESTLRIMHADGREMAMIDLKSQGSTTGFEKLGAGQAEVAMASRRARDGDLPLLAAAGISDLRNTGSEVVIGLDGLIVVTHPDNPVASLSLEDLALIFSGTSTNWADFGGPNAPITVYARDDSSGTLQTFASLILEPYGLGVSPVAIRVDSNTAVSDGVSGDPLGVGFTSLAYQRAAKALPIRQECGILSFPTSFSMKTEEYPLSRRLYLYATPENLSPHARRLIEFAGTSAAQDIIADNGFVSGAVESRSLEDQGARIIHALIGEADTPIGFLRQMLRDLRTAERLSITLRFTPGGSVLDPRSAADAQRLADAINDGDYAGKELLLVGFTDSVGQFELNRSLSVRRARTVEDVLRNIISPEAQESVLLTAEGYGELSPVGCNTSVQGRTANRRVEIWVRDQG